MIFLYISLIFSLVLSPAVFAVQKIVQKGQNYPIISTQLSNYSKSNLVHFLDPVTQQPIPGNLRQVITEVSNRYPNLVLDFDSTINTTQFPHSLLQNRQVLDERIEDLIDQYGNQLSTTLNNLCGDLQLTDTYRQVL